MFTENQRDLVTITFYKPPGDYTLLYESVIFCHIFTIRGPYIKLTIRTLKRGDMPFKILIRFGL